MNKLRIDDDETLLSYLNLVEDIKTDLLNTRGINLRDQFSFSERILLICKIIFKKLLLRVKFINIFTINLFKKTSNMRLIIKLIAFFRNFIFNLFNEVINKIIIYQEKVAIKNYCIKGV